jgi:Flp pilus assembly protein TadG
MLKQSKLAAAVVTAALASAAFASAASANPIDSFTINSAGNMYQFGSTCSIGAPPSPSATLDWRNNAAGTSGAPQVSGTLCLQNTTDETRVKVLYHDSTGGQITRFVSPSLTGTGGPLDTSAILDGGPRINYATLDHVHIDVEHRAPGGNWILAGTSTQFP